MENKLEQFGKFLDYINFSPFESYPNFYQQYLEYCLESSVIDPMSKIEFEDSCQKLEEEMVRDVYKAFGQKYPEKH